MKKLITLVLGSLLVFVACTKKEESVTPTTTDSQVAPPPVGTPAVSPGAVAPGAVDPHAGHGHAPGAHPEPK